MFTTICRTQSDGSRKSTRTWRRKNCPTLRSNRMLTDFKRTITITPKELAVELAQSGDLVAIGAFLNTLGTTLAQVRDAEPDGVRKDGMSNLSFNLGLAVEK